MSPRILVAMMAGAAMFVPSLSLPAQTDATTPPVATRSGALRGAVVDGIHVFKGIPYGASTAGAGRFKPPQPPASWPGVRDAVSYGDQCPQMPPTGGNDKPDPTARISEDCLVLNVWTPGLGDKTRPVMVWLHGGGYIVGSGASPNTDGARLARRGDLVVVTLNHRLNAFGHLYLGDIGGAEFADSGNVGQLDIVQALQWVRDNISAFGGDPAQVTVFGESGGGGKVGTLMAMPAANGLFRAGILQSGSGIMQIPAAEATRISQAVLRELKLSPTQMRELQRVPVDRLIDALRKVNNGSVLGSGPVVDGRSLPRHPFAPDAPAQSAHLPVIVGWNKDEATVLFPPADAFTLDWAGLKRHLVTAMPQADIDKVIAALREQRPQATPSDLYFAVTTELGMGSNARLLATRKAAQHAAPVFLYRMDWETPANGGRLRAHHGLDVPLVFDNVPNGAAMMGEGAADAQRVADAMSDAWIQFARTGNPNAPGRPYWPPFDEQLQPTMIFNVVSGAVTDPVRDLRLLFLKPPQRSE